MTTTTTATDTADVAWDVETDDYQIRWCQEEGEPRPIRIYNQGEFVCDLPIHAGGLSADVNSKRAMTLNEARDGIAPEDPVWKAINTKIKRKLRQLQRHEKKQKAMTETRRLPLIAALLHPCSDTAKAMLVDWAKTFNYDPGDPLPLLRDNRGRYRSFDTLSERPVTIVPIGREREAKAITKEKLAVPITANELQVWSVETAEALIEQYNTIVTPRLWGFLHPARPQGQSALLRVEARVAKFETISRELNAGAALLVPKDLTPVELAALGAFESASSILRRGLVDFFESPPAKRRVFLGDSCIAPSWTDASTYIAIHRKTARLLDRGLSGAIQITLRILREYLCADVNLHESDRGSQFYDSYYGLASNDSGNILIGEVAQKMWHRYQALLNRNGLALPDPARTTYLRMGHPPATRSFVYKITLGSGGLSEFAKEVLGKIGADYAVHGSELTLKSNDPFLYTRISLLKLWLLWQIPLELKTLRERQEKSCVNLFEVDSFSRDKLATVASAWSNETGGHPGSYLAACDLLQNNATQQNASSALIQFLVTDPNTDLLDYEKQPFGSLPVYTVGGPDYALDLTFREYRSLKRRKTADNGQRGALYKRQDDRAELVMSRVRQAITSITNPEERAAIIATLQSDNFAQELANPSPPDSHLSERDIAYDG